MSNPVLGALITFKILFQRLALLLLLSESGRSSPCDADSGCWNGSPNYVERLQGVLHGDQPILEMAVCLRCLPVVLRIDQLLGGAAVQLLREL